MRRVVIVGPPGSGKSTLARRLGAATGLPVVHLDRHFWRPGWVRPRPEDFAAEVEDLAAGAAWIIEGNYPQTLAARLGRADTLLYLDVPAWRTTWRVVRRSLLRRHRPRTDLPPGCPERVNLGFYRLAWTWNRNNRAAILALAEGFAGRTVILRHPTTRAALAEVLGRP